jgi:hypothetical protein
VLYFVSEVRRATALVPFCGTGEESPGFTGQGAG